MEEHTLHASLLLATAPHITIRPLIVYTPTVHAVCHSRLLALRVLITPKGLERCAPIVFSNPVGGRAAYGRRDGRCAGLFACSAWNGIGCVQWERKYLLFRNFLQSQALCQAQCACFGSPSELVPQAVRGVPWLIPRQIS